MDLICVFDYFKILNINFLFFIFFDLMCSEAPYNKERIHENFQQPLISLMILKKMLFYISDLCLTKQCTITNYLQFFKQMIKV